MSTLLWIILGLMVWSLASIPLALILGRVLRYSGSTSEPAPRERTTLALAA